MTPPRRGRGEWVPSPDRLAGARAVNLDPDVNAAIDAVGPDVATYATLAGELVAQAATNPADAKARLSKFTEAFNVLEGSLEELSGTISSHADGTAAAAHAEGSRATKMSIRHPHHPRRC